MVADVRRNDQVIDGEQVGPLIPAEGITEVDRDPVSAQSFELPWMSILGFLDVLAVMVGAVMLARRHERRTATRGHPPGPRAHEVVFTGSRESRAVGGRCAEFVPARRAAWGWPVEPVPPGPAAGSRSGRLFGASQIPRRCPPKFHGLRRPIPGFSRVRTGEADQAVGSPPGCRKTGATRLGRRPLVTPAQYGPGDVTVATTAGANMRLVGAHPAGGRPCSPMNIAPPTVTNPTMQVITPTASCA